MYASQALHRFVPQVVRRFGLRATVLDIGSGDGEHARIMEACGLMVEVIDWQYGLDYASMTLPLEKYHGIWMSHVLEHALDVHSWLLKVYSELKPGGILGVTVPPAKNEIVGGHVSLWNAGLLCYRLILAGFDCRDARVGTYGYNISVILEKREALIPRLAMDNGDSEKLAHYFPVQKLAMDNGDIEKLAHYFPVHMQQSTSGEFPDVRW